MRRGYDKSSRRVMTMFFKNCERLIAERKISSPTDLGEVAAVMRQLAKMFEGESQFDDYQSYAIKAFDEAEAEDLAELAVELLRDTGLAMKLVTST